MLVKHSSDLTKLNWTCVGSSIYLDGILKKDGYGDFTIMQLENMLKEIERMFPGASLQCNMENWNAQSSYGEWQIQAKKKSSKGGSGSFNQEVLVIKDADPLADLIQELKSDED